MRSRLVPGGAALAVLLATAAPAGAATILLNNIGGAGVGPQAYSGFTTAANFWASQIANPITINLNVGFGHLGPNVLGQTRSTFTSKAIQAVEGRLASHAADSLDALAV